MDVVSAVTSSSGVRYRGELGKATGKGSNERTVESVPTGPTFSPQDSERARRTEPPVVQLIRESAENMAANLAESSRNPAPEGGVTGSQVDAYA